MVFDQITLAKLVSYSFFEKVFKLRDESIPVTVLFFDFAKAFDRVDHDRMLIKLSAHGIEGNLLNWFSLFLSDRSQVVKIGEALSSPLPRSSGVLQGSVLGPLICSIFVNDLPNVIQHSTPFFCR